LICLIGTTIFIIWWRRKKAEKVPLDVQLKNQIKKLHEEVAKNNFSDPEASTPDGFNKNINTSSDDVELEEFTSDSPSVQPSTYHHGRAHSGYVKQL